MSSLTRLLEELPQEFFDDGRMAQGAKITTALGAGMLGLSGVLAMIAVGTGEFGIIAGSIGPAVAGLGNLCLGLYFRKRSQVSTKIQLTQDARQLLLALLVERVPVSRNHLSHGHRVGTGLHSRPLVIVPAPLEEKLESFAGAYLDLRAAAERSSVHGIRARLAADAALADGFNAAAASIRHPDGDEEAKLDRMAEGLREVARHLDPAESAPPALDALLSDLREEAKARQELFG